METTWGLGLPPRVSGDGDAEENNYILWFGGHKVVCPWIFSFLIKLDWDFDVRILVWQL